MKRILIVFALCIAMITGCTGINTGVATNVAIDTAFVMVLQNNPDYRPAVVEALKTIKDYLAGSVTYEALILEISKRFPDKYRFVGVILTSYLEADKPVSTSMIPMLESYKAAVIAKIDRLLLLAG